MCRPAEKDLANQVASALKQGRSSEASTLMCKLMQECPRSRRVQASTNALHACARCAGPEAASWAVQQVARMGIVINVVTFNSVINKCAEEANVSKAVAWFSQMQRVGVPPNALTYRAIVKAFARARASEGAEAWLDRMIADDVPPCPSTFGLVIHMFARSGQWRKAVEWFERAEACGLPPDLVMFNSVINACAKAREVRQAEQWLARMRTEGIQPDGKTYNSLISACAQAGFVDRAERWFYEMERDGCMADEVAFGSIIHACAKVGDVARAELWFEEMPRRGIPANMVIFNTLLHACAVSGDAQKAASWFDAICQSGLQPNDISYNTVLDAHAQDGATSELQWWLGKMIHGGHHPDAVTFGILLRAVSPARTAGQHGPACHRRARDLIASACLSAGDRGAWEHWAHLEDQALSKLCWPKGGRLAAPSATPRSAAPQPLRQEAPVSLHVAKAGLGVGALGATGAVALHGAPQQPLPAKVPWPRCFGRPLAAEPAWPEKPTDGAAEANNSEWSSTTATPPSTERGARAPGSACSEGRPSVGICAVDRTRGDATVVAFRGVSGDMAASRRFAGWEPTGWPSTMVVRL